MYGLSMPYWISIVSEFVTASMPKGASQKKTPVDPGHRSHLFDLEAYLQPTLRPMRRRPLMILRPLLVRMRARKPTVRRRLMLLTRLG